MKLPPFLANIPHLDKWLHAIGCLFLYAVLRWGFNAENINSWAVVVCIAAAKEYWDGQDPAKQTKDWWDFFAGVLPVTFVAIFWG